MSILTRRSVIRSSVGFAAAGALARPYIANAAAKTAEVWWVQGFVKEEDVAFKKMVDDYEKQSGNKIEQSITPYAALRQKEIAAIQTGVVPDVMEIADFALAPLQSWDDRLTDITDGVDPINTFNAWMIANGGLNLVTADGKLHTDDPAVKQACVKALVSLATPFKQGYVPPGCVNWNDADDNNAFHSKLMVMDFDGTISTEVALLSMGRKDDFEDVLT